MAPGLTTTLTQTLATLPSPGATDLEFELAGLREELERVAREALFAEQIGLSIPEATRDARFPALRGFHHGLRDALLLEIPQHLRGLVDALAAGEKPAQPAQEDALSPGGVARRAAALLEHLVSLARPQPQSTFEPHGESRDADPMHVGASDAPSPTGVIRAADRENATAMGPTQRALAELLVYESVRLRLLALAWSTPEFEVFGGDDEEVDEVTWDEVRALLRAPALSDPEIRPMPLLVAASTVALTRATNDRAEALRASGEDLREELAMRSRLRTALRELRLVDSVLLTNALSPLLGEERLGLTELASVHTFALEGMSRSSMDQRISRGRRALASDRSKWPHRRSPALFDLLRERAVSGTLA